MQSTSGAIKTSESGLQQQGLVLAQWDDHVSEALLRLMQLMGKPTDTAILDESRLRELYCAVLRGE